MREIQALASYSAVANQEQLRAAPKLNGQRASSVYDQMAVADAVQFRQEQEELRRQKKLVQKQQAEFWQAQTSVQSSSAAGAADAQRQVEREKATVLRSIDVAEKQSLASAKKAHQELIRKEHVAQMASNQKVRAVEQQSNLLLEQQTLAYDRLLKAQQDAIKRERRQQTLETQQFNKALRESPSVEKALEPARRKEHGEALPHYAAFIEGNQREFRARLARADQRNVQIYAETLASKVRTQTLAERERDQMLTQMAQAHQARKAAAQHGLDAQLRQQDAAHAKKLQQKAQFNRGQGAGER